MNREQAINYLRSSGMSAEQIKTVVEALQPEPCEDCVSRKWLLECVEAGGFGFSEKDTNILVHLIRDTAPSVQPEHTMAEISGDWIDRNLIGDLVDSHGNVHYEDIKNLPSAQSERRKGKWIPCDGDNRGYASTFECSACNNLVQYAYFVKHIDYDYCPYCGSYNGGGAG